MEIQLQELIDQIKKDGVAAAEAEAEAIVSGAREKAGEIIAAAKAEAEGIIRAAREENDRFVKSGEDAVRQAGRNLLISFRESVSRELTGVLGAEVKAVYSQDGFAELIARAVEGWAARPDAGSLELILGAEDLQKLEGELLSALKGRMLKGVTLKPGEGFDGGFRIAEKDGGVYYDFSSEAVVEMLSNYLNPRITALLKEAE